MTDDKTRQLKNRIDKLESTIEKMMPSRRDALKMGGAALLGGAAMSGTASAGTNQVGTIGSQASPVDLESEDINNADTVTTQDLVVNGTATGPFGSDLQGVRVFLSSSKSISTGNRLKIPYDSVVYDSGNNFDTSTHNFTCPKTGIYFAKNLVSFTGGSDGDSRVSMIGNATQGFPDAEGGITEIKSDKGSVRLIATTMTKYSQGDTIAGYALNRNSVDVVQKGNANFRTHLEVVFLGQL